MCILSYVFRVKATRFLSNIYFIIAVAVVVAFEIRRIEKIDFVIFLFPFCGCRTIPLYISNDNPSYGDYPVIGIYYPSYFKRVNRKPRVCLNEETLFHQMTR